MAVLGTGSGAGVSSVGFVGRIEYPFGPTVSSGVVESIGSGVDCRPFRIWEVVSVVEGDFGLCRRRLIQLEFLRSLRDS